MGHEKHDEKLVKTVQDLLSSLGSNWIGLERGLHLLSHLAAARRILEVGKGVCKGLDVKWKMHDHAG